MRSDFILDRVRLLFSGLKLWEEINVSCVEGIGNEDGIRFELICIYESKKINNIYNTQDKKWFDFGFKINFFCIFYFNIESGLLC